MIELDRGINFVSPNTNPRLIKIVDDLYDNADLIELHEAWKCAFDAQERLNAIKEKLKV